MPQRFTQLSQMDAEFFAEFAPKMGEYQQSQWKRIVWSLRELVHCQEPWPFDQLSHSLQMADRVAKAGHADELILAALCHDMGKVMGYQHHGEIAAEVLRPYVSDTTYHLVRVHQDFEIYHARHLDPALAQRRESYKDEPWYEQAIEFTSYDQASFDPDYTCPSLEHFIPLISSLCAKPSGRVPGSSSQGAASSSTK